MARLVWTEDGEERSVALGAGPTVVGTDPHCAVLLKDAGVSAVHCEIRRAPDGWSVVDLESRNGTKVNGQYVNQARLGDGTVIEVGGVRATFRADATETGMGTPVVAPPSAPPVARIGAARAKAPVPRHLRAAPAARGGRGDEDDEEEGPGERQAARDRRARDRTTTMLLVGAGVLGLVVVGWLLVNALGTDTPNHRRRIEMTAAERRMDWQEVLRVAAEATDDGSHDWAAIQELAARARSALAADETGKRIVASNGAWNDVRTWRQENRSEDAEYVRRLDAYLAQWGDLGSDGVNQAKAERLRVAGSSSSGAGPGGPWQALADDLKIHEADGTYREAFAKLDAFLAGPAAADPSLRAAAEAERARLLAAAKRWFDKQVALARHYHSNGEKNKARKTLMLAADKVGLPELEDRAKTEIDALSKQ